MVSLCPPLWCGAHTSITAVSEVETPMQPQQPGKSPRKVNQALEWLYPKDHQPGERGPKGIHCCLV